MTKKTKHNGSVLLITLFIIAMFSALVAGMLWINTEEMQLMKNEIFAAQALSIAEAGLNDAFSQIRVNSGWSSGFNNKTFSDGRYTVTVAGNTIQSVGTSAQGFIARVAADITIGNTNPYVIRIDSLRINE